MSNVLFETMNGGNNVTQMLGQLRQNPLAMLQRAGFNVPGGLTSPQDIVRHLVASGQVNQQQLDHAQRMAQIFKG